MTSNTTVTIITGASEGIGAELARQLATRYGAGLSLVLAARKREAAMFEQLGLIGCGGIAVCIFYGIFVNDQHIASLCGVFSA